MSIGAPILCDLLPGVEAPEDATILLLLYPEGHGADDYETDEGAAYTIEMRGDEGRLGWFDYNLIDADENEEEQLIHIRWVEVGETQRRRGVATAMLDAALAQHPGSLLQSSGETELGELFIEDYEENHPEAMLPREYGEPTKHGM